ncbi:MAG: LytR C-terminal domain-containing protein [Actinomycetota bacterium]|nr:MAG: cell envelope-related function transcriptional attenuator common domain [Actinomycetota bacterium]MDO8948958.1 LytR C-terminal domain-containing protein [Actinomycetota bacterium]MDP3630280.1 LytR C-terminal domain-containing protein [Actinomycetota bacterium]
MSRKHRKHDADVEQTPVEEAVPTVAPDRSGVDYPRRRTHVEKPEQPAAGYRASKRSSKGGKRLRQSVKADRVKAGVSEKAETAGKALGTGLRYAGIALGALVGLVLVFMLVATGINSAARFLAKRQAVAANSPEAVQERAQDNLLVIGTDGTSGADFLAIRLDEVNGQIFGIAIPDGAFMEVPGQGFERIGDSYKAGPAVSMAAISNYLGVPFGKHVVVTKQTYQDALTNQSLAGLMDAVVSSDLDAAGKAKVKAFMDGVKTAQVALVPLPVKPINLADQTYFEPQRDQVADLLLSWWGVRLSADDGVIRVIVYNGSGSPGTAGEAAQVLIKAGMRVVDTKNADRFDYKETLIVVQDGDLAKGESVKKVLGVGKIVNQPSEQDVANIIIIVGQDWKPSKG